MRAKTRTGRMMFIAMVAAVIAIVSQIRVPLGQIPFTLAVFGVFFAGAILPPLDAVASIGVYLAIGVLGVPVFSNMTGGPQALVGPTGGFLAGYFLIVLITAHTCRRVHSPWLQGLCVPASLLVFYAAAVPWYMLVTGSPLAGALAVCVVPFILPDFVKGILALALARVLRSRYERGRQV